MAEPVPIYDPDKKKAVTRPDLQALEGGGKTSPPTGNLSAAPEPTDLAKKEKTPTDPYRVGRGYTAGGEAPRSIRGLFKTRRRKLIGLGTGLIGGGIIGFILLFLPVLRLESYLVNINQRVFGFASSAVSQRVEHLFERYMITRVIHLDRCGAKTTGDCSADYTNKGVAGGLYNAWRDAKVEQKLIDRYDLKFETRKNPSSKLGVDRITIRSAKTGKVITLTEGQLNAGRFTGGDREFGREINKFLKENTRWYEVMQRRSVRKYLVRKHGVVFWCFLACKTKDTVELKTADAKTRFKYKFVERAVFPFSGKLGFIMFCIMDGGDTGPRGNCSPEELRKRGIDRDVLADEDINKIVKDFKEKPNARLGQYLTEKLLEKIMSKQAARATIATIPIAGQIYFAAVVIDMLDRMDGFIDNNGLSKMAADLNARQYLEYYTMMRSANDEMKAGVSSASEVGAIMTDFNGAEQSLVYQTYNSQKTTASLFGTRAYAAEKENYLCADGKPIPRGELVCPEKKISRTFKIEDWRNNSLVEGLVTALNRYECAIPKLPVVGCPPGASPRSFIRPVLGGIDTIASTIVGPIVSTVFSGIEKLPYVGDALSYAKGKSEELMTAFLGKVFPLPVQLTSPGREKYDALEAGGEVAASEFGKGGYTESGQSYGLGGKLLTPEEQTVVWQNYMEQQEYEYRSSSFLAKLTNLEYSNSLASRFIAAMPNSFSQLAQKFGALISNPPSSFSLNTPAYAAPNLATSPFGISRFGYPVNDPIFNMDPAQLTEEYCQNAKTTWESSKSENSITGFDEYAVTNPCLLEQVAVEAASSAFTNNDSLDDTIADSQNEQPSEGAPPSGSAQQMAQQILQAAKAGRVKFNVLHSTDILDGSTPEQNIQQTANGQPAHTTSTCGIGGRGAQPPVSTVALDTNLLRFILELTQAQNIQINTIAGQCHSTTTSNHYQGKAVDFGCPFGTFTADRTGSKYGVSRNNESCADLKGPHYHYSVGGG